MINEITFMQIRIVRLFAQRFSLEVNEVNRIFNENKIYELIEDCYGVYHCGGDEIVYNDVLEIFRKNGVLV